MFALITEDGTLIVATPNDGTFMIFRGIILSLNYLCVYLSLSLSHTHTHTHTDGSTLLVIDKSLPIAQMSIAHRHQLVLLRSGIVINNSQLADSLINYRTFKRYQSFLCCTFGGISQ